MIKSNHLLGLAALAAAITSVAPARADFSYEQTSTITGGAMLSMMKVAGVFSKQAREPIRSAVAVKGDRMLHANANTASIIDLAKETITQIDYQKKTWSVMTFAEMQQAMAELAKRRKQGEGPEMKFKVEVNPTGNAKQFQGLEAKEVILKMTMEATDAQSGQKGGMTITSDLWLAPAVAGYNEVRAFQRRMAEKLAWNPGAGFMSMMNQPEMSKGMAGLSSELAKMDGVPVYQVMKMGASGQPGTEGQPASGTTPPPQQQQQQQQQADKPSTGSGLGGALGGRLGRFGGLGRKKSAPKDDSAAPAQQQQQQPAGQSQDASGVLMEMVSEMSGFSAAPVDAAKFEVPAGFKKVDANARRGR